MQIHRPSVVGGLTSYTYFTQQLHVFMLLGVTDLWCLLAVEPGDSLNDLLSLSHPTLHYVEPC